MTELPSEIWLKIIGYLPDHQVRSLYSVNRAFHNSSLDLRYKNASIGILPDRVIEQTKRPILRNQSLSSRPTNLQITFYDSSDFPGPNLVQPKFLSSLKTFLPSVIHWTMGHKPKPLPPTVRLAHILYAMPNLTHLTRLRFTSHCEFNASEASVIFPEVLGSIGHRLRALHIQSPFVAYLPPRLESLESFSLDARIPHHTPKFHRIMVEKVPGFLKAHRSTLRDVSFANDVIYNDINLKPRDVTPILRALRLIPCLHSLSLSLLYYPEMEASLAQFEELHTILDTHQEHLRSFTLVVSDTRHGLDNAFFSRQWVSVKLPNLTTLTISLPGVPYNQSYVTQFRHSLISLKMLPIEKSTRSVNRHREIILFCDNLKEFPHLRELSIHLSIFDPFYLFLLADALPRLCSLYVNFFSVSHNFHDEQKMDSTRFSNWALESLDYETDGSQSDDWLDRQLVIRLPSVVWVNKKTRKECLSGSSNGPRLTVEDDDSLMTVPWARFMPFRWS